MNQVCEICHRKFYREGIKNHYINEKVHENLCKVGFNFNINSKIICCHSCSSCLSNNKTPAISYLNLLYPGSVPDELKKLNLIEISCISRVKPYMKIMKMNNVFGQASFKGLKYIFELFFKFQIHNLGNVVHFAQAIEEVFEQLPLKLIDSDNIIVTDKRENVSNIKQFSTTHF